MSIHLSQHKLESTGHLKLRQAVGLEPTIAEQDRATAQAWKRLKKRMRQNRTA